MMNIDNSVTVDDLSNFVANENLQLINERYGGVLNLVQRLGSSAENGLTDQEASNPGRTEVFGENKMDEIAQKSFFFFRLGSRS